MRIQVGDTAIGGFQYEFLRGLTCLATGAADVDECFLTAARILEGDFEGWIREWTGTADGVAADGEAAHLRNQVSTARGALLRASNYYRLAEFYARHDDPRQDRLWRRSRETFQQAGALLDRPVEPVGIPFEGVELPGYFVRGGPGRRRTLIAMGGYDSSGEEVYHWIGAAGTERGWNVLIFEGPGQRGALHLYPALRLRHDYEVVVSAVVDYAVARPEVDQAGLAFIGYSLGGNLAPRALAFEHRFKAGIANSLIVDVAEAFRAVWPESLKHARGVDFDRAFAEVVGGAPHVEWAIDHARWSHGITRPHEFFPAWEKFNLEGLERQITVPMLFCIGEDGMRQTSARNLQLMRTWIDGVRTPTTEHVFTRERGGAAHCQIGALFHAQAVIFAWLEATVPPSEASAHASAAAATER